MNPDLLRSEFLGVTVRFDTVEFDRADLASLFADVSTSYDVPRLEFTDDGGATMSNPDGAELVLHPTQAACGGVTRLGYREGRERVEGLLGESLERFDVGTVWLEDITIVATWDLEDEDAGRRLIIDDVVRFDHERLALLGDEDDDLSLGLRIWRSLGEGSIDCSIEPMHADSSRIYLRVVYSQREIDMDFAGVLATMDEVNQYLRGPLREFVVAVARQ